MTTALLVVRNRKVKERLLGVLESIVDEVQVEENPSAAIAAFHTQAHNFVIVSHASFRRNIDMLIAGFRSAYGGEHALLLLWLGKTDSPLEDAVSAQIDGAVADTTALRERIVSHSSTLPSDPDDSQEMPFSIELEDAFDEQQGPPTLGDIRLLWERSLTESFYSLLDVERGLAPVQLNARLETFTERFGDLPVHFGPAASALAGLCKEMAFVFADADERALYDSGLSGAGRPGSVLDPPSGE